ncbi:sigma-70 family RNA polymerase sigma factor [Nonomuraea sp. ZG12]|uniref:sigma-70 family RNA polymerase sigma factor n=1 Tax=Nonomuraea sp. ZG12 TaxID=3452207 RepID=UPI003F898B4C
MAGWPTVERADELELVKALRRADTGAPDRLYGAYAERLFDYASSLLGDRDRAADCVHDALVTAQGCVDRLKDAGRLRPWLYALTRFQAMARLGHRGQDRTPPPAIEDPEDPELAELVRETLGELSRNAREVLELSLRHGLTASEVGSVLGLTSRQVAGRLGRARDTLENAAAAVVLARTQRAHCPDLSAMVDSWEGPLTPLLRRRLSGHIGRCEVCTERRHRQVSAGRLLGLVPVPLPPLSLRGKVVGTCVDPGLDQTRTLITDRGDSFDRTGFPVAHEDRSRRRGRRGLAPVVLAGACVLAGTSALIVLNAGETATSALHVPPSSLPTEDEDYAFESPEGTPSTEPVATPTPSPSGGEPTGATPSRRAAVTGATTRPPAVPTPTRRRAAPAARLSVGCPSGIEDAAEVGLRARNAAVTWSAGTSSGLNVSPATGSIKAGGSVVVLVTVDDPGAAGSGTISFTSNGGGATCSLSWPGDDPRPQTPPSEEPLPDLDPTGTPRASSESTPVESAADTARDTTGDGVREDAGSESLHATDGH